MNLLHGVGDFFSLDIGTNSMRIVQLSGDRSRGWTLTNFAYVPIDPALVQDSSDLGRRRLGEAILGAVNQAGIKTKNIALGIPANKTFTSIVETETLSPKEMKQAFRYEIEKYVPMPMNEAKADYAILDPSPNDPAKTEVLVSSVSKEYAETILELVEKMGLNVIAMEPEPLAMARSLGPVGAIDATMIVDFGENSTDLVIVSKGQPRLVRTIPGGISVLVKTVANSLGVEENQARQFILKFGLAEDKIEGQVFRVLSPLLDNYAAELTKSVRFYQTKYINGRVGGIILSSFANAVPLFAEYIEAKTGISAMRGNAWQFVHMTPEQEQLLSPVANEFAVAIGLAERSND